MQKIKIAEKQMFDWINYSDYLLCYGKPFPGAFWLQNTEIGLTTEPQLDLQQTL